VTVDANEAGNGKMEIMINDGEVPCKVENTGFRQYCASFTPTTAGPHMVQIRFNGHEIEGEYTFLFINPCFFMLIDSFQEILVFLFTATNVFSCQAFIAHRFITRPCGNLSLDVLIFCG
jgi:hypothetical protein